MARRTHTKVENIYFSSALMHVCGAQNKYFMPADERRRMHTFISPAVWRNPHCTQPRPQTRAVVNFSLHVISMVLLRGEKRFHALCFLSFANTKQGKMKYQTNCSGGALCFRENLISQLLVSFLYQKTRNVFLLTQH